MHAYPGFLSSKECASVISSWTPSKSKIHRRMHVYKPHIRNTEYVDYARGYVDWKLDLHMLIWHNVASKHTMYVEKITGKEHFFTGTATWTAMVYLHEPNMGHMVCWMNDTSRSMYTDIVSDGLIAVKHFDVLERR